MLGFGVVFNFFSQNLQRWTLALASWIDHNFYLTIIFVRKTSQLKKWEG